MPFKGQQLKDYLKGYYLKHRDKIMAKSECWYKANRRRALYIKKASFARRKYGSGLTADLVQMVYEDNIKKYGTLTCVVCGKRVRFGDDNLEHNVSLSRGGTNEYSNLGVAHHACNSLKNARTLKECKGKIKLQILSHHM